MATSNQKQVGVAKSDQPVNLNPKAKDCYFYFYSRCAKGGACPFRHCSAAADSEESCFDWTTSGVCRRDICPYRHSFPTRQRSVIPCYWESQPTGCLKPHCPFLHSKPRPQVPGAKERVTQYKFSSIKIKTLDEIKQVKSQQPGSAQREDEGRREEDEIKEGRSIAGQKTENPPSFGAVHSSVVRGEVSADFENDKPLGGSIFSARKSSASIFSPDYVSDPKNVNDVIITSPEKRFSFSIESESSDESNLTTPTDDSNKCPPPSGGETLVGAVRGVKRPSSEKLEPAEMKKPRLAQPLRKLQQANSRSVSTAPSGGRDFHIKSLDEIRAEKRKTTSSVAEETGHVTPSSSHVTDPSGHVNESSSHMTDIVKDTLVKKDQKTNVKKKIVLIRRKPGAMTVTNGNPSDTDTGNNSTTLKKVKLVRPLTFENPSTTSNDIQESPPTQSREKAAKSGTIFATNSPGNDKEKTSHLNTTATTITKSCVVKPVRPLSLAPPANRTGEEEEEDEQCTAASGARVKGPGVTVLPHEAGLLLSPLVEDGREGEGGRGLAGRGTTGRKMSVAEMMKVEIQSELLQRQASEVHEELLDAELEQLAEELSSTAEDVAPLADSKTDDDLMLEMEEFI